jgi:hypothetical protein
VISNYHLANSTSSMQAIMVEIEFGGLGDEHVRALR